MCKLKMSVMSFKELSLKNSSRCNTFSLETLSTCHAWIRYALEVNIWFFILTLPFFSNLGRFNMHAKYAVRGMTNLTGTCCYSSFWKHPGDHYWLKTVITPRNPFHNTVLLSSLSNASCSYKGIHNLTVCSQHTLDNNQTSHAAPGRPDETMKI